MNIKPHACKVDRSPAEIEQALKASPLGLAFLRNDSSVGRYLAVELAFVWQEFCRRLDMVPFFQKVEQGTVTLDDYKTFLINHRQQLIEGGSWISRAASSMDREMLPLRSVLIGHAAEEHQHHKMVEAMYIGLGGSLEEITHRPRNVGTEAFSGYVFHELTKPNPIHFFGGMFIVEGFGALKAGRLGRLIQQQLSLRDEDVIFFTHHGEHDDTHFDKLRTALSMPEITQEVALRLVKMAKTVGRLYCLQFEELDNY